MLAGQISSEGEERPPELLVANGRLAGVAGGYRREGDRVEFTAHDVGGAVVGEAAAQLRHGASYFGR